MNLPIFSKKLIFVNILEVNLVSIFALSLSTKSFFHKVIKNRLYFLKLLLLTCWKIYPRRKLQFYFLANEYIPTIFIFRLESDVALDIFFNQIYFAVMLREKGLKRYRSRGFLDLVRRKVGISWMKN
jgi:hypothetical protein